MRFTSEQRLDDGVLEREFTLGEIPGVLWTRGSAPAPLILSGHNGGLHKRDPRLVARARHHAAEYGFAVGAIDAPGHGDRPRSAVDEIGGPVGYAGMTAIGIRLAVVEPRISAAGFFAGGFVPDTLREEARKVTIPLQFLLQWDDEGMERQPALDLFDAFGTREKTLHANLGGHAGVPWFEVDDGARFFARHLK
jgi:hypothetical protein